MDRFRFADTTLSGLTRSLVLRLAPAKEDRIALARRAGLSIIALEGPLDDESARTIWSVAEETSGDADIGLHFAEAASLQDLGIVGYLGRASATIAEACARVVRLQRWFKEDADLQLISDEGRLSIVDVPLPDRPAWPRHLAETTMASWLLWPQRFADTPFVPLRVRFQHPRPARIDEHERVFGAPIEFGSDVNELVLSAEIGALPLQTSDALLAQYLESAAAEEHRRRFRADPFLERLEGTIVQLMPGGGLAATRVARAIGVSPRSLHRRLQERGVTYQAMVDDLRRRAALSLLERGEHNITEVAFLVGFSDPSGFRRAFRRWTGRAPRDR